MKKRFWQSHLDFLYFIKYFPSQCNVQYRRFGNPVRKDRTFRYNTDGMASLTASDALIVRLQTAETTEFSSRTLDQSQYADKV